MLTAAQFREDHAHAVMDRPDLTDEKIDRIIQVLYDEYCLEGTDLQIEIAIGNAACHRLSVMPAAGDCGALAAMTGRLLQIGTDIESYKTNAVPMKNPSDWSSTACGGLFQKYIDTYSGGVGRVNFHEPEIPYFWW
jgi:hypothetical protein